MKRLLPVAFVLLAPSAALADPPRAGSDPAAAQVLFFDARQLMEKGKYTEACPKLEESLRLDAGVGTQFNLADCNEHVGKLASAWAGFLEVAAEAKAANQPDREKLARKRAAAIEPRLPKLIVEAPPVATPGLEVKRDGILVGAAAFGTAIPVDAGTHRVVATAPGKQWETTVQASESKTTRVALPSDLPARVGGAALPDTVDTGAPAASEAMASFPPPVIERPGGAQRAIGWAVAGLGVVGLGLGAGFGLSSMSKRDDSRAHCVVDACDADGVALRDDALRNGNIATIATIAGGAAVVGGVVLVLTAPRARERAGVLRAVPTAAQNGGGLMLQGTFQ
ncbi:MAG TPA: hypothetical protein VLT33_25685 [Labilithrix sp.]|nr:hypothetical protein [Labilithrix sp.]